MYAFLILANSAYPEEMQHYAVFHLVVCQSTGLRVSYIQRVNVLISICTYFTIKTIITKCLIMEVDFHYPEWLDGTFSQFTFHMIPD